MTKYEYVKQEISDLLDSELVDLYNDFAEENHYEMIWPNTRQMVIDYFANDLEKYLKEIDKNKNYSANHSYFIEDAYGHIKGFNVVEFEVDLDAVVKWIDENDYYDRYEHLFDYYEDCEEEEEE